VIWRIQLGLLQLCNYVMCVCVCLTQKYCSKVHVQNVQFCYIGIHVLWWFAAPINLSSTLGNSFISF
uniref:Uncharacterized protein n=1 Tax=Macaca fascicularis TaxID=9541 RepID=A0A7N9CH46_MACFA